MADDPATKRARTWASELQQNEMDTLEKSVLNLVSRMVAGVATKCSDTKQEAEASARATEAQSAAVLEEAEKIKDALTTQAEVQDSIVTINVGGVVHTTSVHTLNAPDTFFSAYFKACWSSRERDEFGHLFLDRDGLLFQHVLDFLRSGKESLRILAESMPGEQYLRRLEAEFEFYGIRVPGVPKTRSYFTFHGGESTDCSRTVASSITRIGATARKNNNYEATPTNTQPRQGAASTIHDGVMITSGGYVNGDVADDPMAMTVHDRALSDVRTFDPAEEIWRHLTDMQFTRFHHASCVVGSGLYILGGTGHRSRIVITGSVNYFNSP